MSLSQTRYIGTQVADGVYATTADVDYGYVDGPLLNGGKYRAQRLASGVYGVGPCHLIEGQMLNSVTRKPGVLVAEDRYAVAKCLTADPAGYGVFMTIILTINDIFSYCGSLSQTIEYLPDSLVPWECAGENLVFSSDPVANLLCQPNAGISECETGGLCPKTPDRIGFDFPVINYLFYNYHNDTYTAGSSLGSGYTTLQRMSRALGPPLIYAPTTDPCLQYLATPPPRYFRHWHTDYQLVAGLYSVGPGPGIPFTARLAIVTRSGARALYKLNYVIWGATPPENPRVFHTPSVDGPTENWPSTIDVYGNGWLPGPPVVYPTSWRFTLAGMNDSEANITYTMNYTWQQSGDPEFSIWQAMTTPHRFARLIYGYG